MESDLDVAYKQVYELKERVQTLESELDSVHDEKGRKADREVEPSDQETDTLLQRPSSETVEAGEASRPARIVKADAIVNADG